MASESDSVQATTIQALSTSVYPAIAMIAGMKLDVFTPLSDGPKTVDEIAAALSVQSGKLRPLMHALVVAKLVEVEAGRFRNTSESDKFLVKGRPLYRGNSAMHWATLWEAALETADSIRAGAPMAKHDFAEMSAAELEAFHFGSAGGAAAAGRELARRFDFAGYKSFLDIAGGSGALAMAVTEAWPQLDATVVDLPGVVPITRKFLDQAGAGDRIDVLGIDLVRESLGAEYDAAAMRSLIQVLSPEDAARAMLNVGAAIRPGGVLHILGIVLDDSRTAPLESVGMGLVFVNFYDDGGAYTEGEYREWLAAAGFKDIERAMITDAHSIITARKAD